MEIIRSIMPVFLSVVEMVINNLAGKMDFFEFQEQLANKLNEIGCEITREVLEEMDRQIKEESNRCRLNQPLYQSSVDKGIHTLRQGRFSRCLFSPTMS